MAALAGQIAELVRVLGDISEQELMAIIFVVNNCQVNFPSGSSINDYSRGDGGTTIEEASEAISQVLGRSVQSIRHSYYTRSAMFTGDSFMTLVLRTIERLRDGGLRIID